MPANWIVENPPEEGAEQAPAAPKWIVENPTTSVGVSDLVKEAVPFNFGAKAAAGVRAVGGESYSKALEDERAKTAAFREEHPEYAIGANLAGGLIPGLGILGKLGQAATTTGTIARGVGIGAGIGAVS